MQKLRYLYKSEDTVFYELTGNDSDVVSYVVSHPSTRRFLTNQNIQGGEFLGLLREASSDMLRYFPEEWDIENTDEDSIAVHSTLRGGLNWDIKGVFYDVFGKDVIHSMSSCQRYRIPAIGRFVPTKTRYDRTIIPENATIIFPDIIATGMTSKRMLKNIIRTARRGGKNIWDVVFLTIGSDRAYDVAKDVDEKMGMFLGYDRTILVFHEGVFTLAENHSPVRIKQTRTDFLKRDALLTPEYVIELYGDDSEEFARNVLTPCAIGDGFSRGGHKEGYFGELLDYWREEIALASEGVTLLDEMDSRWPENGFDDMETLRSLKSREWSGVDDYMLRRIHDLHLERWGDGFRSYAGSGEALKKICADQIKLLGG